MNITPPNVNINGTSQDDLVKQVSDVANALRSLKEAMLKATPHGRDYYDPEMARKARNEHSERLKAILEMESAYTQLAIDIFDQRR